LPILVQISGANVTQPLSQIFNSFATPHPKRTSFGVPLASRRTGGYGAVTGGHLLGITQKWETRHGIDPE